MWLVRACQQRHEQVDSDLVISSSIIDAAFPSRNVFGSDQTNKNQASTFTQNRVYVTSNTPQESEWQNGWLQITLEEVYQQSMDTINLYIWTINVKSWMQLWTTEGMWHVIKQEGKCCFKLVVILNFASGLAGSTSLPDVHPCISGLIIVVPHSLGLSRPGWGICACNFCSYVLHSQPLNFSNLQNSEKWRSKHIVCFQRNVSLTSFWETFWQD